MTTAFPPDTIEAIRTLGGSLAHVPEVASHLPVIAAVDEPAGWMLPWFVWSRGAASIAVSLVGHVGILAWLGFSSSMFFEHRIPVEQGQASIQLEATLASAAARAAEMTVEQVDPDRNSPSWEELAAVPSSVNALRATPVALARVDRSCPIQDEDTPEIDQPTLSAPAPPMEHREDDDSAGPRRSEAPNPRMERAEVAVEPAIELVAETVAPAESAASSASDASMAADGANSIPALVFNPAPQYPPAALKARQTGRVTVHVKIQPDGSVSEAAVHKSSGIPALDQAALAAVRAWQFAPLDGLSNSVRQAAIPIRFVID